MTSLLVAQIWKVFWECHTKVVWVQNKLIVPAAHLHNIIDGENYLVCGNGSKSFIRPRWERPWGKWMEGLFLYLIFVLHIYRNIRVCVENCDLHCIAFLKAFTSNKHCCGDPITRVNVLGSGDSTYMRGVTALVHLRHSAFIKVVGRSTLKWIVVFRLVGKLT